MNINISASEANRGKENCGFMRYIHNINLKSQRDEKFVETIFNRLMQGRLLDVWDTVNYSFKEKVKASPYVFAIMFNNEIMALTGKDLLEYIPFSEDGRHDKYCFNLNSLTEQDLLMLEINNIRVHENLKMKQEDEVEYE